ncbi:hypothetical protein SADUNF_Sadunf16G0284000 [Salix dunnii]|uniref:Uncharacterized protein n=1 Tax=Salix dunnii TaxID=1413687 RepID=A0A835JCQ2_9ROSI|nr:hypothetical protein SADUNF_Sadunf16G0284000 [Salix dunnii]
MDLMIKPLAPCRSVSKSRHRKQRIFKMKTERRETMERLKQIWQKFVEIESECRRLKEETMNIASQSDYNQIRINLMLRILKARQDNDFARADHLTRLLREEMKKLEQGGKAGVVG